MEIYGLFLYPKPRLPPREASRVFTKLLRSAPNRLASRNFPEASPDEFDADFAGDGPPAELLGLEPPGELGAFLLGLGPLAEALVFYLLDCQSTHYHWW